MKVAARLRAVVQYFYRFTTHLWHITSPAYKLAVNAPEKLSVTRFALKLVTLRAASVAGRFIKGHILTEDTAIVLHGTTYYVGVTSQETALFREIYDERSYDEVVDFIPRAGWTVLDIGANIGIFAIQQAQRGARIHAFEPNPDCFRRLAKAVAANKLEGKISIYNLAVAASPGSGTMIVPDGFTPGGSIVSVEDAALSEGPVFPVTSLDHFIPTSGISRIDLLKIDTEGAEVEILRGSTQTLTVVDRIVLEYHSHELLKEVRDLLDSARFEEVLHVDQDVSAGRGVLYAKRES